MIVPEVSFEHLLRLSDGVGVFEHARFTEPRREHGYCVDDVARALRIAVLHPTADPQVGALALLCLDFVLDAQTADGRVHNRRDLDGTWTDEATLDDCWGRALWGLGTAVAHDPGRADRALAGFERSAGRRSAWPRAMAFAGLGAAEVVRVRPDHAAARALLGDAAGAVPHGRPDSGWRWPEPRLSYANAAFPEVLVAAGALLDSPAALAGGLDLLTWLLEVETRHGHLSVTPAGGRAPGDPRPGFDQQPIEVAALADACARAFDVTADPVWMLGLLSASAWFLGDNDARVPLDHPTGGCCDGLEPAGRNENQGAESTLAMMATFQQTHRLLAAAR